LITEISSQLSLFDMQSAVHLVLESIYFSHRRLDAVFLFLFMFLGNVLVLVHVLVSCFLFLVFVFMFMFVG
jgi:hypothetical protein